MCGRFVRKSTTKDIAEFFGVQNVQADMAPSFNVAPTQPIVVIIEAGEKKLVRMQWGLIPAWARDASIASKLINARSETITEKPAFKSSFKNRRCLIVADGFYEWKIENGKKVPVYIYFENQKPFAMAGLYDYWTSPGGENISSCTIITTEANEFMRDIHHRMPVIVRPEDYDVWLNPEVHDEKLLKQVLQPFDTLQMKAHRVSLVVNSPLHNAEECIKPV